MAETITHSFISAKADSADPTLVSSSEWNDNHKLVGTAEGQIVTYNTANAPSNVRYVDGTRRGNGSYVIPGAIALPATLPFSVVLTLSTTAYCLVIVTPHAITPVNPLTVGIKHNAVNVRNFIIPATTVHHTCLQWVQPGIVGVNTFEVILDGAGSVTSGDIFMQVMSFGF